MIFIQKVSQCLMYRKDFFYIARVSSDCFASPFKVYIYTKSSWISRMLALSENPTRDTWRAMVFGGNPYQSVLRAVLYSV